MWDIRESDILVQLGIPNVMFLDIFMKPNELLSNTGHGSGCDKVSAGAVILLGLGESRQQGWRCCNCFLENDAGLCESFDVSTLS